MKSRLPRTAHSAYRVLYLQQKSLCIQFSTQNTIWFSRTEDKKISSKLYNYVELFDTLDLQLYRLSKIFVGLVERSCDF